MTNRKFEALCTRVLNGGDPTDRAALIKYARDLRVQVVDAINDSDTWDQDWPIVGYKRWGDGATEDDGPDDPITWAKAHGWGSR
jgi:hypothetical protein